MRLVGEWFWFESGGCYVGESRSHGDLECVTMSNRARSRCSKTSRFLCGPHPPLQSSIASLSPVLARLPHLTAASNSLRGPELF